MTQLELTDDQREWMRYDPAEHREFKTENGRPCLHLGHECNTPIYVLDGYAHNACAAQPASWRAKVSWRFPMLSGDDRLAVRPGFFYIANQADQNRWLGDAELGLQPVPFHEPHWMWKGKFGFAVERRIGKHSSTLAGGVIESGCFACIKLTRYRPEHAEQTLLAVAEVIEALSSDRDSLLAHEHDWCCFCGRHLVEPRSRAVGYGPDCAVRYQLAY